MNSGYSLNVEPAGSAGKPNMESGKRVIEDDF